VIVINVSIDPLGKIHIIRFTHTPGIEIFFTVTWGLVILQFYRGTVFVLYLGGGLNSQMQILSGVNSLVSNFNIIW
jgi:hypothetical protein